MLKYQDTVANQFGQPVANATITVLILNTATLATLFSDSAGQNATTNPVTTGADGTFNFYVADGRYTLQVGGVNIAATQQTDIEIADITGGTNPSDLPIQVNVIDVPQSAAPALSAGGHGRLYFDTGAQKFRFSENGGLYQNAFGASGAGGHALLDGNIDNDTVLVTPTLGDIIAVNASSKFDKVSGNTTATRKFLRQTGTGSVSAVPTWDTLQLGDIPAGVELTANKNVASGYMGLDGSTLAGTAQLGTGTPNATTFLRGDRTWAVPPTGSGGTFTPLVFFTNSDTIVQNTTVETNFPAWSLSAGDSNVVGRVYMLKTGGIYSTVAATTPTLQFKLLVVGTTTFGVPVVFTTPAGASALGWEITATLVRVSSGATGKVEVFMRVAIDGLTVGTAQVGLNVSTGGGNTWDGTVANSVTFSVKWGAAAGGNTITQKYFEVERRNN